MSLIRRAGARVPPRAVRALGRAQFRYPMLQRVLAPLQRALTTGEGTIAHGLGAGLRFDATGGHPGYVLGTSDPEEQRFLSEHLRPGNVFYDIGANVGFFATLGGRLVGETGRVYAFEPFPVSAAQIAHNAKLNDFAHVQVVEAAVADTDGRAHFKLAPEGTVNHSLASADDSRDGIEVEVVSIDGWRARTGAPPPDVVMIDVEGAELRVLDGIQKTLAEHRPTFLIEVHWLGSQFLEYVERHVEPEGYSLRALKGDPTSELVRWHAVLLPDPPAG